MMMETVSNIEIANGGELLLRLASGGRPEYQYVILRLQVGIKIKNNMRSSSLLGQTTVTPTVLHTF